MEIINNQESRDERMLGVIAHLLAFGGLIIPFGNFIGPLILYLVKKSESEFVADQALESLNFQISVILYCVAIALLMITIIGIPFAIIGLISLFVVSLIFPIIGAISANKGEYYRYPGNLRLINPDSF